MENQLVSKRHQNFIGFMLEGLDYRDAAEKAGFDRNHADRDALAPCLIPAVQAMCKKYVRGRLDMEGAPAAYRFFMWTLRKADAPWSARIEAAKVLLNHSVAAPKAQDAEADNDKNPSEMTRAELDAYLKRAEDELARRGLLIEATPSQPIDDII